jgi:hypothetical protein
LWFATFHVHAIQSLGFSDYQISMIFSLNSIPGLLVVFSPKFIGRIAPKMVVVYISVMVAIALIVVSQTQQWLYITLGMLAISTGRILIYTMASALSTERARNRIYAQKLLARLRSFGPLALITSSLIVIIVLPYTSYPWLFFCMSCLLAGSAFYAYRFAKWSLPGERATSIHISKALWSYYLMNFLSGSRSILFRAFVITLLVREFDFDKSNTALLFAAGSVAGFVGYRLIAMLSTTLSPRLILGGAYTLVGLLFIGFALIKIPAVLVFLYLVDSLIFGVSIVTDSTLKVLVKPSELLGQISTGLSIFHIAGIILPLVAGLILAVTDNLTLIFLFAAALAWIAAITSQIHCAIVEKFEKKIATVGRVQ